MPMRTYAPISAAVLLAASALTVTGSVPVATAAAAPATWDHVTLIMFENKPLKKIIGNTADAPYINAIAKACSYSKNDLSLSTTSLANYIALTSGYTGCDGLFTVTHTPFPYYTRTQKTLCPQYAKPFPANSADVLSAKFNLVIPNKQDIMHLVPNSTISQRIQNGDNWLKGYLPGLLNSATYQAGRSAIIITWDEGNGSTYTVPLIVITPYTTAGGVSSVAVDHYSVLKGMEQMVGQTQLLGHAGDPGKSSIRDDTLFRLK